MQSFNQIRILIINGGIAIMVILLFLTSCQEDKDNPPPENLLDEQTYIDLIIEFQLIDAYYNRYGARKDTLSDFTVMRDSVLDRYDTNWKQFKKSHDYYKNQPGKQLNRVDKAIEKLRKRNRRPMGEPQE